MGVVWWLGTLLGYPGTVPRPGTPDAAPGRRNSTAAAAAAASADLALRLPYFTKLQ